MSRDCRLRMRRERLRTLSTGYRHKRRPNGNHWVGARQVRRVNARTPVWVHATPCARDAWHIRRLETFMIDRNTTTNSTSSSTPLPLGRHWLTYSGMELFSMPTLTTRRLGVERLKVAREAGDRLATCVLGMCAIEGTAGAPDEAAGVGLLKEAADMGSCRAESYLARHLLSGWEGPELAETEGLAGRALRLAERENAERLTGHRERTRGYWRYLRGPILRGSVTEAEYPAIRAVYDEIVWRGRVTDALELDCCMVIGSAGNAHATYLAALAYESGDGGTLCLDVAARLMRRSMSMGHHDALMWVRFARREGLVA